MQVFDATNNKLTDFPRQLAHLTSLQRLILSANSLSSIDGSVLLPLAATLKILVLDSNSITQIPDEVCTFRGQLQPLLVEVGVGRGKGVYLAG